MCKAISRVAFRSDTGGPRNSQTFYLRIRLFTLGKVVQNNNFLVKNGLFICEFSIHGPKWRNVSTTNFEENLYKERNRYYHIMCIFFGYTNKQYYAFPSYVEPISSYHSQKATYWFRTGVGNFFGLHRPHHLHHNFSNIFTSNIVAKCR